MFFSRDLSSLIELQVTANCNVDGMIDAPNVRSLTLTKMESRNNDRPWGFCARSVLGALRTMHYLRSLRLLGSSHFFHNLNEEQAFSTEEPVILHALRYFIMSGSLMNWRLLIPRCIFPATVRRFSLATVVNTDTTVGNIAKLTHYIFAKRDAHLWALVLTTTPAGYLIQGSFAPDEVPEPSMLPDSTDLWLHCVNGTLPEERLLTLLAKLPLAGLHALSVFGTAARDNLVPTCLRDAVFGEDVLDSAPFVRTMPGTDMEAEAEPVEWRTIFPSLKSVHWHPSP
ncbi:hypothetical protein PsYK624_099600 [Phanerochaete sordida]|uniref:Uncharacterized protein n=1 Tax=Phanerochaete sordida TaxID=48140 RepID=A0A9P3GCX4_9APHY|nr:hypothetical protein PsYK624_099600 [Phanerochaete sordida]